MQTYIAVLCGGEVNGDAAMAWLRGRTTKGYKKMAGLPLLFHKRGD